MTAPTSTPPSPPVSASTITQSTLNALLLRYDALITHPSTSSSGSHTTNSAPSNLQTLDHLRYTEIPHRLAARKKDAESNDGKGGGGGAYLEKAEVEDLVRWKLSVTPSSPPSPPHRGNQPHRIARPWPSPPPYPPLFQTPAPASSQANVIRRSHGTFRPRLTQLVASNGAQTVRDTTRRAFAIYAGAGEGQGQEGGETYVSAIKTLATLKGVGPATASLLLAVYEPARVPFFADELYRWVCCGGEWGEGIKYTVGEYKALWEGVRGVRDRMNTTGEGKGDGVRAVELEKAAWVLGREARGGGGGGSGGGKKGRAQATGQRKKEVATEPGTKKRKSANKSRADGESRPDDEREIDNVNSSTSSSPAPPDPPDKNLTTSVPSSIPEPNRPISPPLKRQPSNPNASRTKNKPTADRPLRRSKRTKLS